VQQLFLKLKEVFSWAKKENIADVEKQLYFIVSLSPNYFLQIAKLRAIRILWQQFLIDNNIPVVPAYIHAINSWNYNTAVDHENILRHTTEAMSAIIGGCDVLFLTTSDEAAQMNTAFLNRINTNIQHLLKHESHFNKVQDMAAGSYYIENITAQIVAAAMAK
jgi:methylmalonyl-CoA mutase